jgi:hypothetical protein
MKTKKLKIKSIKPHSNFQEEIYQQEKTDKFLNTTLWIIGTLTVINGIILLIVNLTR